MRPRVLLAALAAAAVACAGSPAATAAAPPGGKQPYVVVLKRSVSDVGARADSLERTAGFETDHRYRHALKGFAARLDAAQAQRLRSDSSVAYLAVDRPVKAMLVPVAAGDSVPTGVRRMEAGSLAGVNQASTANVAVIDTGIQLNHPDLNAADGIDCITPGTTADDNNGHGTHAAGSVAARNNGAGVVGVAPGTRVYAVKVLNASGNGSLSTVLCGIDWVRNNAAALNIKVANMSLGGGGSDDGNCGASSGDPEHAAICAATAAGITFVVAAGNAGVNFAGSVPAAYDEALTVTALSDSDGAPGGVGGSPACRPSESDEQPALFSNFALDADAGHTVAAPGVCITSTWTGSTYDTISGTSMASPHVAGVVALCHGSGGAPGPCSGLTPAQIVQRLRGDAALRASMTGPAYGFFGDPDSPIGARYYGHLAAGEPPRPPGATTGGASAIETSAATVSGTVSPLRLATSYRFDYGRTSGYGSSTPAQSAAGAGGLLPVSARLEGLAAGALYHYRLVAQSGAGTTFGADQTFNTTAPPGTAPAAATLAPATRVAMSIAVQRLRSVLRRGLRLQVSCPAECSVSSQASVARRLARRLGIARAASVVVARGSKSRAGAGTVTVVVRFTRKARARLRRARAVSLAIRTAVLTGGRTHRVTGKVALKR